MTVVSLEDYDRLLGLACEAALDQRSSILRDYADERGIIVHTARNQLESLMAKAGIAHQSQLIALFATPLTGVK